jgi:hypothetical protein
VKTAQKGLLKDVEGMVTPEDPEEPPEEPPEELPELELFEQGVLAPPLITQTPFTSLYPATHTAQ